jgi:hypothetical protein
VPRALRGTRVPTGPQQQRFEDFRYPRKFGAILVPVGTFTLIDDLAVAQSVLRRFRDHLEPGGSWCSTSSR